MTISIKHLGLMAFAVIGFVIGAYFIQSAHAASFPDPRQDGTKVASSTTWTLAWGGSQRVMATSTGSGGRMAVALQAMGCQTNGYISFGFNDVAAATTSQYIITASSTVVLGDSMPMPRGSIQAQASVGNCSLLITEFRSPV